MNNVSSAEVFTQENDTALGRMSGSSFLLSRYAFFIVVGLIPQCSFLFPDLSVKELLFILFIVVVVGVGWGSELFSPDV